MYDVYWANALFSQADRDFNAKCAKVLRDHNISVFLPQESNTNESKAPTEVEIFESDVAAIKNSKILVACIDQESIDCGVACEIGMACELGMYTIGFYTDIRKDRAVYTMYKNPFVLGAILKNGIIVETMEALLDLLIQRVKIVS